MKPPDDELSARHLPTPTQRCTAAVKSPPSSAKANPPAASTGSARGRRRSASSGRGSTTTPGLSRSSGSSRCLNPRKSASACGEYISDSSSLRARPSPCSPDREPPCRVTSSAARVTKERSAEPSRSSGRSIRTCTQPSPKWP